MGNPDFETCSKEAEMKPQARQHDCRLALAVTNAVGIFIDGKNMQVLGLAAGGTHRAMKACTYVSLTDKFRRKILSVLLSFRALTKPTYLV